MIIPTPEFDPFFADVPGQSFQDRMIDYIREEFADTLAEHPQARQQLNQLTSQTAKPSELAIPEVARRSEAA